MFGTLSAARPEACASDLQLDLYLAQELQAQRASELAAHLAQCERCSGRLAELTRLTSAYLASPEASLLHQTLRTRERERAVPRGPSAPSDARAKRGRVVSLGAGACVLLAAATFLLLRLPASEHTAEPTTRLKGSSRIGFFVKHGEHVRAGEAGERVVPGDLLRFTYATNEPGFLTILSYDGAQRTSVYLESSPIGAGQNVALPSAVELDETLGPERIFGLFCRDSMPTSQLVSLLTQQAGQLVAPAGCELSVLSIVKEPWL
jgi:hypothetical protein